MQSGVSCTSPRLPEVKEAVQKAFFYGRSYVGLMDPDNVEQVTDWYFKRQKSEFRDWHGVYIEFLLSSQSEKLPALIINQRSMEPN